MCRVKVAVNADGTTSTGIDANPTTTVTKASSKYAGWTWMRTPTDKALRVGAVVVVLLSCRFSSLFFDASSTTTAALAAVTTAAAALVLLIRLLISSSRNNNNTQEKIAYRKENFPHDESKLTWRQDGGISKLVPVHPPIRKNRFLKDVIIDDDEDTSEETKQTLLPAYTMAQVAERNTVEQAWIVMDERVYDITQFLAKHPGGEMVLINMLGKDCTDSFANYHQARIYKTWLPPFLVGRVTDVPVYPHVQDFRNIRQELLRRGLFETSPWYYTKLCLWLACLLGTGLYLSLGCPSATAHFFGAVLVGLFWQQMSGLGHDLGHSSVSHNPPWDNWIGSTIGCALLGISTGWWRRSHNTHHVVCNSIEHDPDIQQIPVIAMSGKAIEKPFWSTYHKRVIHMDALARFWIRYQHILFIPLMMLARWNLHAQSWIFLYTTTNKDAIEMHNRTEEIIATVVHAAWGLGVALCMPTWGQFFMWGLVSHAMCALLHLQICASHYAMHIYHGHAYNDEEDEWYMMQIKTSMNYDCYEWADYLYIGLQFQIEHHLYPNLPRHNLRLARSMVKDECAKHGISHHEPSFYEAVKETLAHLRGIALKAQTGVYDQKGMSLSKSMLMDAVNAQG